MIFDEASQVEPADAYGAIARGRQLLLVGDEKQLPPTELLRQARSASRTSTESDEFAATGPREHPRPGRTVRMPNRCRLRWHYRSRHASLIEFSNEPSTTTRRSGSSRTRTRSRGDGSHVPVRRGGSVQARPGQHNPVEAAAVAAEVVKHALEHPDLSLGVGAFSMAQQRAIQDEIERIRRESADDRLEAFVASTREEPFFVKNLETIQGDERDVILLSVGYGPDAAGKITMNFGPLNREGGWRRLNVLVTRAKRRCVVFSSIQSDQIVVDAGTPRGVAALKDYLYFAEHGRMPTTMAPGGVPESPFEEDVAKALQDRGWEVHSQVGTAGFAIDIAVVDPARRGRYLLGIECDGATYHSSNTARDRDRLRQSVLEGLGWQMYRVWSEDWFYRRDVTLTKLLERLELAKSATIATPPPPSPPPLSPPAPAAEPAQSKGPSTPRVESNRNDAVVPYTRRNASHGDHGMLVSMRPAQVANVVVEIVREEWPIHVDEATRAVAARFDTRASKKTQEAFAQGLATAIVMGGVARRGDFLWAGQPSEVRVRRRDGDCPVTKPELIAPEEFMAAVRLVIGREFGVAREAVASSVAKLMGYARSGGALAAAIEDAVDRLVAAGEVVLDSQGFLVLPKG